jgi:2-keto-3-deoxy-L-rhamnonate aldolase RhmA
LFACTLLAIDSPVTHAQGAAGTNRIVDLLSENKVVLGWFAPARTPDAARKAARDPHMDFVFVNMEQVDSYRPAEVKTFVAALREAGGKPVLPLMLRIPIFHDDPASARTRVAEVLGLGVQAVVFPGMESGEEAREALDAMKKTTVYPHNPKGDRASIFIIESEKGIANSREITRERPTVAIPGPGTLSRVYNGDMEQVERAIQTQLASCKEFDVPCGITAGPTDVARRIKEGFRMIIMYDRDYPATMKAARDAAGRD